MDHQEPAVAVIGAVIGVREAGIDREIIVGVRIYQAGRDRIEALGGLAVALSDLRAEIAGPAADRVDLEQLDAPAGTLLPDFELGFFLEDADEDRGNASGMFLCRSRDSSRGGNSLVALLGNGLAVFGKAPGMAPKTRRTIRKLRGAERGGSTRYPPTTEYISGPGTDSGSIRGRRFPIGNLHGLSYALRPLRKRRRLILLTRLVVHSCRL